MNVQADLLRLGNTPRRGRPGRLGQTATLLVSLLLLTAARSAAAEGAGEVWLVSTRGAPVCGDLEAGCAQIEYWRLGPDHAWQAADAAAFHQGDRPELPTTVFLHGNRLDADEAVEEGCCV